MEIDRILQSRKFIIAVGALFGLALLVGVFIGGVALGLRKARFSNDWSDNYQRNFVGPRGGPLGVMRGWGGYDFMDAHGTAGTIIKIVAGASADQAILTIKDANNTEKSVVANVQTTIQQFRQTIKLTDLKDGVNVVVIGEPDNQGQIEAKFIRLLPTASPIPTSSPTNNH